LPRKGAVVTMVESVVISDDDDDDNDNFIKMAM
jgi:hypothetical protein